MNAFDRLNKLAKWRSVFASWQLGTRSSADGESRAVRDHREVTILMRAENSALAGLLIRKGIFTQEEFEQQVGEEAEALDEAYESKFPGFTTSQDGVHMKLPEAGQTMTDMGFPP